jgi:hypothetical protein
MAPKARAGLRVGARHGARRLAHGAPSRLPGRRGGRHRARARGAAGRRAPERGRRRRERGRRRVVERGWWGGEAPGRRRVSDAPSARARQLVGGAALELERRGRSLPTGAPPSATPPAPFRGARQRARVSGRGGARDGALCGLHSPRGPSRVSRALSRRRHGRATALARRRRRRGGRFAA